MGFLIRDCMYCGTASAQMYARGSAMFDELNSHVLVQCSVCKKGSIYRGQPQGDPTAINGQLDIGRYYADRPTLAMPAGAVLSNDIPPRVRDLYRQASNARWFQMYDASGAMFRKTIDVATKLLFGLDPRLAGKNPADAPRARIKALGQFKILEEDIVELADVALLDGNDAAHDVDPYSAVEAEALEELTLDLLDRMFVRPARIAAVKAKQVAAGQRKPDAQA